MPELSGIKRNIVDEPKAAARLPAKKTKKAAPPAESVQQAIHEIAGAKDQLGKQLPKVSKKIVSVRKHFEKKADNPKIKSVLKDLDKLNEECDIAINQIKTFQPGRNKSEISKELQKIKKMIDSLQANPVMQIRASEVTVFWSVIGVFFQYIDAFERASVQPRRLRVEGVTNEQLDSE